MRSAAPTEDLTTKAKIRNAALHLFPELGFGATTIRAVAGEAGVSPALVLHHFGSKEGLRADCDRYVVAVFRQTKMESLEEGKMADPGFLSSAYEIAQHIMRYLGWALARNHPAAGELFDEMLNQTLDITRTAIERGMMTDSPDLRRRTAVLLAQQMGMIVLHDHLERATGVDILQADGIREITPTLLEIFSGLFTRMVLDQVTATNLGESEAGVSR